MASPLRAALSGVFALLALPLLPSAAGAAPILRPAVLSLAIQIPGSGTYDPGTLLPAPLGVSVSGSVSVDATAGTLRIASGVFAATQPIVRLETGSTALSSLSLVGFGNGAGTFSVGGAAVSGELACPPLLDSACVAQSGFGGAMPVLGTLNLVLVPSAVTLPVPLGAAAVGLGGPAFSGTGSTFDGAPFSVGAGAVRGSTSFGTLATAGSITASGFTLVAPVFVRTLGLEVALVTRLQVTFTDGQGVPGFVSQTVPEPGALLLLAAGAAGLVLAARRG